MDMRGTNPFRLERTLAGEADQFKEHAVGMAVLDRGDHVPRHARPAPRVVAVLVIRLASRAVSGWLPDGRWRRADSSNQP